MRSWEREVARLGGELRRCQAALKEAQAEAKYWQNCYLEQQRAFNSTYVNPAELVERTLAGMKAIVAPDLPPSAEPVDLYGGVEREILNGHVPDPAWEVPEMIPQSYVEVTERERLEGGGDG